MPDREQPVDDFSPILIDDIVNRPSMSISREQAMLIDEVLGHPNVIEVISTDGMPEPCVAMDAGGLRPEVPDPQMPLPGTEMDEYHRLHPSFPPHVMNDLDARAWGFAVDGDCNCHDCQWNRIYSQARFYIDNPQYMAQIVKFEPDTRIEETKRHLFPKRDDRFSLPREHDVVIIKNWGHEQTTERASYNKFHEALVGHCPVCRTLFYDKARMRYGVWGNYTMVKLPDERWVCENCITNLPGVQKCQLCGDINLDVDPGVDPISHEEDEDNFVTFTMNGDPTTVCRDCYENQTDCCYECDRRQRNDDMHWDENDHHLCSECWGENHCYCVGCEEEVHNEGAVMARSGDWICSDCLENEWSVCVSCHRAVRGSDGEYSEEDDEFTCNQCINRRRRENPDAYLREHSYKPRPYFRKVAGEAVASTLFFGFELEVENVLNKSTIDDHVAWCQKFWEGRGYGKFCYYKKDGSLHNGLEIVSHPMSWAWLQSNRPILSEFLAGLRQRGLRSFNTDTCGLHVHMNKTAFQGTRLYKYLKFFHTSGGFLWKISGRESMDHMQEWAKVDEDGARRRLLLEETKRKFKCPDKEGKYWAINLEPEETIECRIFKGTLGENSFFRAFEFLRSLYEYCGKGVTKISEVSVDTFMSYVRANAETYPRLAARIKSPSFNAAEHDETGED